MDAQTLLAKAEAHQVGFRPGNKFTTSGNLPNYLRLSFSYYDSAQLVEGAERLGKVLATTSATPLVQNPVLP